MSSSEIFIEIFVSKRCVRDILEENLLELIPEHYALTLLMESLVELLEKILDKNLNNFLEEAPEGNRGAVPGKIPMMCISQSIS